MMGLPPRPRWEEAPRPAVAGVPDAARDVEGAGDGAAEPAGVADAAGVEAMEIWPGVAEAEAASVLVGAGSVVVWTNSGSGLIGGSCWGVAVSLEGCCEEADAGGLLAAPRRGGAFAGAFGGILVKRLKENQSNGLLPC